MANRKLQGSFEGLGLGLTCPSLGPLPMPTDDTVDLNPSWRGFIVLQAGDVTFTGLNGRTETKSFPAGFTIDMMITRIALATTTAEIMGLE